MQPSEGGIAGTSVAESGASGDSQQAAIALWESCIPDLKSRLSEANFTAWFSQTRPDALEGETFVLAVPSPFVRDWIQGRYVNDMRAALTQVAGRPLAIAVVADESLSVDADPEPIDAPAATSTP